MTDIKHYRIRHIPTGMFWKPKTDRFVRNDIGKRGKFYVRKQDLPDLTKITQYCLKDEWIPTDPTEWEIVEYTLIETNTEPIM